MPEVVDHPDHYGGEDDPYEVIKVLEAWDLELARGFCWGNVVKYTARASKKGGLTDRQKAEWYANRLVTIEAELAGREDKDRYRTVTLYNFEVKIDWVARTVDITNHALGGTGSSNAVGGGGGGGSANVSGAAGVGFGGGALGGAGRGY